MTTDYPIVEIAPNTYEIDEFDCSSIFLLVGEKKALVIDAGIGIGDLKGAIEKITDKPLTLAITHGHEDHIGAAWQFGECYLNQEDFECYPFGYRDNLEARRRYASMIAHRERGEHPDYPYDLEKDILPWPQLARRLSLQEGDRFDLGGRVVTAYGCPGHSPGQMAFLDDGSRILFPGDAINANLMFISKPGSPGFVSVERAAAGLRRLQDLSDRYDAIYNGHHDYRPVGKPLPSAVLPDLIALCQRLIDGRFEKVIEKNPMVGWPDQLVVRQGISRIAYIPEGIQELKPIPNEGKA